MKFNDQFKKLDDVGFVGRGKSKHRPRNDESLYGGEYPFVQTGDVRKAEFYLEHYTQTYNEKGLAQSKLWDKGTLCITIAANIAETAVLGIKACFPDSIIGFVPDKEKADVRFIKYCLETYKLQMQAISKGATQDNLSLEKLRSLNFQIPNLSKQKAIADVLYNYDKLIQTNLRRITILEQMAEQLYKEWFVRMRFPNYEKTKFVKGIPLGWEVKSINDLFKTASGGTPSRKLDRNYTNGNIEWLKTGELKNTFTSSSEEKITYEGLKNSSAKIFPRGTIVIAMYCAMPYISILSRESATNQACCAFLKKGKIDYGTFYTYHLIKNAQQHLIQFAHGAAQQNLSQDSIKKYQLFVANIEIVTQFNTIVSPIYKKILNLEEQIENLRLTRNLLLPRLIGGQLQLQTKELNQVEETITPFQQKQLLAYIIKKQEEKNVPSGEMVLAKNTFLIDKIYGVNTGFNWQNWHYGTYDGAIRKLINGRDRFFAKKQVGNSGYKVLVLGENKDKILDAKYYSPKLELVEQAMDDLLTIYSQYPKDERSHKIELLNTTCKAIADTQSVDIKTIRQAFKEWKTEKAEFPTKWHKFNESETKKCIQFIISKGWDKKLLTD